MRHTSGTTRAGFDLRQGSHQNRHDHAILCANLFVFVTVTLSLESRQTSCRSPPTLCNIQANCQNLASLSTNRTREQTVQSFTRGGPRYNTLYRTSGRVWRAQHRAERLFTERHSTVTSFENPSWGRRSSGLLVVKRRNGFR